MAQYEVSVLYRVEAVTHITVEAESEEEAQELARARVAEPDTPPLTHTVVDTRYDWYVEDEILAYEALEVDADHDAVDARKRPMADFRIIRSTSAIAFRPTNEAAEAWWDVHVDAQLYQEFPVGTYHVETSHGTALCAALDQDGFSIDEP